MITAHNASALYEYKQSLNKYPILTAETETSLFQEYHLSKSETAFNKIIQSYLRLVISIVEKNYKNKYSNLNVMDMISAGNIGLVIALKKFDISKEVRFSTYANWWIMAKIQEYIAANISVVKRNQKQVHKTLFTSNKELQILPDMSLDYTSSNNNESAGNSISNNEISQDDFLIYQEEQQRNINILNAIWQTLNNREKYIIYHRFISKTKKTFAAIASEFNISTERVRQLELRIKKYMKDVITGKILLNQKRKSIKYKEKNIENKHLSLDFQKKPL